MWPEHRGDAVSRQIPVERAVEALYAESFRRWVPTIRAGVLPALTAAGALPPDPSAADDQTAQQGWSDTTRDVVLAGIGLLWAATVYEAMTSLGLPIPDLPSLPKNRRTYTYLLDDVDGKALDIVAEAVTLSRAEIAEAVARIDNTPVLAQIRDDMLAAETQRADHMAAVVQDKLAVAQDKAIVLAQKQQLDTADTVIAQRTAVAETLDVGGPTIRQLAESAGHDSGAVQNHAVVEAAVYGQDEDDPLDKVWIATIDSKTRPTHWAADGQRVALKAAFIVGGEALAFPQDPAGSPREIKNCRCRVGILGRDEKLPDEVDRHTERLGGRDATARHREGSQADEIERREREGNIRARDDKDGMGQVASAAPDEGQTMANDDETQAETYRTFSAVIALIGEPTSDSRMLSKKIDLSMRSFPQPLMWCKQTGYGHEDAYTVGVIERAEKVKGKVTATGYLLNTPEADEAANELAHGVTSPSVDLADSEWEATDRDENPIDYETYVKSLDDGDPIKIYTTITKAELIGTTLVATAAFGDTSLTLNAERETRDVPLVAAAVAQFKARTYPAAFFADQHLTEPTPVTSVTVDGVEHVFGHFACEGSCHRGLLGQCVTPPMDDDFANFHTSPPVQLDDGETIAVGRLTVGGGHASTARGVSGADAAAHYDNVATCWALVRVYKDAHGLAFTGVRAPWVSDEQFEQGMSAPLSGDWRDYGRGLKLTAVHSVNTPGYMIASGATDAEGRPLALVASLAPTVDSHPRSVAVAAGIDVDKLAAAIVRKQREDATMEQLMTRAKDRPELPPEPDPMDELMARAKARV